MVELAAAEFQRKYEDRIPAHFAIVIRHRSGVLDTGMLSELSRSGVWGTASSSLTCDEPYLLRFALWEDTPRVTLPVVVRAVIRSSFHALLLPAAAPDARALDGWLREKRSERERCITRAFGGTLGGVRRP